MVLPLVLDLGRGPWFWSRSFVFVVLVRLCLTTKAMSLNTRWEGWIDMIGGLGQGQGEQQKRLVLVRLGLWVRVEGGEGGEGEGEGESEMERGNLKRWAS